MEINYAFLCDYATISKEGKLSVLGIFHQINATNIPYQLPQCFLAFEIELSYAELNREIELQIDCVDQDGQNRVFQASGQMSVGGEAAPGDNPRIAHRVALAGLTFRRAGSYVVTIVLNGREEARIHFDVVRTEPPRRPQISGEAPPVDLE